MPKEKTHKIIHEEKRKKLFTLYEEVRDMRETNRNEIDLGSILKQLKTDYSEDWLLAVEIFEFARKTKDNDLQETALAYLAEISKNHPEFTHLIELGKEF